MSHVVGLRVIGSIEYAANRRPVRDAYEVIYAISMPASGRCQREYKQIIWMGFYAVYMLTGGFFLVAKFAV